MSTDWIKMRVDLRTHPKVVRMAGALKADKLRVIGGLFAVWSIFDAHSSDGVLDGYNFHAIDDELGWRGFAQAMRNIEWLSEDGESLTAPRFEEHNGQSAKRRAMETERKRLEREADKVATKSGQTSASDADKKRTRGEGEGEKNLFDESKGGDSVVTLPAQVCRALKAAGIAAVNPSHPTLLALLEAGASIEEFVGAASKASRKRDPFPYLLSVVQGQREDAAKSADGLHRGAMPARAKTFREIDAENGKQAVREWTGGLMHGLPELPKDDSNTIDMEAPHGTVIATR